MVKNSSPGAVAQQQKEQENRQGQRQQVSAIMQLCEAVTQWDVQAQPMRYNTLQTAAVSFQFVGSFAVALCCYACTWC